MTCQHSLPSGAFCCRVLGLVLSPRWGGAVVVDGFGIAPVPTTPAEARDPRRRTSFRTLCLRTVKTATDRRRVIERQLAQVVQEHAPTIAILGVHQSEARDHPALRAIARRFLTVRGIAVVERRIVDARRLLLGRARGKCRGDLPEVLTETFFPERRGRLAVGPEERRYDRHAWNALALAITTLAEMKPSSANALLQPGATLLPAFEELLTHAAKDFRG
jgi:hypothetical protein